MKFLGREFPSARTRVAFLLFNDTDEEPEGSQSFPVDQMVAPGETPDVTGLQVWIGATFFVDWMLNRTHRDQFGGLVRNALVLELGSGTGYVGLAVAVNFAAHAVVMTDGDPAVCRLLQHNASMNLSRVNSATELVAARLPWQDAATFPWTSLVSLRSRAPLSFEARDLVLLGVEVSVTPSAARLCVTAAQQLGMPYAVRFGAQASVYLVMCHVVRLAVVAPGQREQSDSALSELLQVARSVGFHLMSQVSLLSELDMLNRAEESEHSALRADARQTLIDQLHAHDAEDAFLLTFLLRPAAAGT